MRYIYYIDGEKFTTENKNSISFKDISSLNESTPAFEDLSTGHKIWMLKGRIRHRLTGPANKNYHSKEFYLNGKFYQNAKSWLKDHPNPDLYFNAIGVFTETDKILWYLQN
jgi:hypothetical protein